MDSSMKEYGFVLGLNIIFGMVTVTFLGGMPYIPLNPMSYGTVAAFVMWFIYGVILCEITVVFVCKLSGLKYLRWSVLFGVVVAFIKTFGDFLVGKIFPQSISMKGAAIKDEIVTTLFLLLLVSFLLFVVAKKKIKLKNIKIPKSFYLIIVMVVLYVAFVVNYYTQNRLAIEKFEATTKEIQNLDFHFAFKILNGNVWFFIILITAYWISVRQITKEFEK